MLSHSYITPGDDDINEIQLQITSSNDNVWYYEDTGWRMDGSFYLGCDQPSYERESIAIDIRSTITGLDIDKTIYSYAQNLTIQQFLR